MEKDNFTMEAHARGYAVIRSVKEQRTRSRSAELHQRTEGQMSEH